MTDEGSSSPEIASEPDVYSGFVEAVDRGDYLAARQIQRDMPEIPADRSDRDAVLAAREVIATDPAAVALAVGLGIFLLIIVIVL